MRKKRLLSYTIFFTVTLLYASPFPDALKLEMAGQIAEAQITYHTIYTQTNDYEQLFHSARLLFEKGDFALSEVQLREFLALDVDSSLKKEGLILMAFIYGASGRNTEGLAVARQLASLDEPGPKAIYLYYVLAVNSGEESDKEKALFFLKERYENSPEFSLVQNNNPSISLFPPLMLAVPRGHSENSPATIEVPPRMERDEEIMQGDFGAAVQVGSFSLKANAEKMIEKIKSISLQPELREGNLDSAPLYRVVIPIKATSAEALRDKGNEILILLKDYRIEAFMLF
jgi:tetratricopeptide (TPR) repeat protein